MNENFMKEKPVLPLILSMSLPMVLSMMVNSLYNIVDSFFVAQISEDAMTALSLVYPVQNFVNAIGIGFGIGINAVIAIHLGAGDEKKANMATTQGMLLALIHTPLSEIHTDLNTLYKEQSEDETYTEARRLSLAQTKSSSPDS